MIGFDVWLAANTQPGPADDWSKCTKARRVTEAYCLSVGLPVCDSESPSLMDSMRSLGFIDDVSPEPWSNRVLIGDSKYLGRRM